MGIEPTQSAWKAEVLPLNYTRLPHCNTTIETYLNKIQADLVLLSRSGII